MLTCRLNVEKVDFAAPRFWKPGTLKSEVQTLCSCEILIVQSERFNFDHCNLRRKLQDASYLGNECINKFEFLLKCEQQDHVKEQNCYLYLFKRYIVNYTVTRI